MTKKRTLTLVLALVAVMIIGVGIAAAQGPRNGQRGQGNAGAFGQNLRIQQQLHDPALLNDPLYQQQWLQQQEQQQLMDGTGAGSMNARRGQGRGAQGTWGGQMLNGSALHIDYDTMPAFEGDLPADVQTALLAGLTDELHAYAVYDAILAEFGTVAPFSAIINSEASHAAALQSALDYYGVDTSGVAPATEALDVTSVAEACQIAADAEIANFELYDSWIDSVSEYPDLVQIFTNLRNASEFNHLPAFEACAG